MFVRSYELCNNFNIMINKDVFVKSFLLFFCICKFLKIKKKVIYIDFFEKLFFYNLLIQDVDQGKEYGLYKSRF